MPGCRSSCAFFAWTWRQFTSGFFSAIIVTAWDSPHRVLEARLMCLVWAAIAGAGLWYAGLTLRGPLPFGGVSLELQRDIGQLNTET